MVEPGIFPGDLLGVVRPRKTDMDGCICVHEDEA
jgi:SOS-response transcriptional repressor LexA